MFKFSASGNSFFIRSEEQLVFTQEVINRNWSTFVLVSFLISENRSREYLYFFIIDLWKVFVVVTQLVVTCSKSTIETTEQCVKFVES